jgi:hypothetical protein
LRLSDDGEWLLPMVRKMPPMVRDRFWTAGEEGILGAVNLKNPPNDQINSHNLSCMLLYFFTQGFSIHDVSSPGGSAGFRAAGNP